MTTPRIQLEPARYAMTGGGVSMRLRPGYEGEEFGGTLDAPEFIAIGSVSDRGQRINGRPFLFTTDVRGRQ